MFAAETAKPAFCPPPDQELLLNVVFGTGGGRALHAEILRPKVPPNEPMPAVLLIHGGGWSGGTHLTYYAPWLVSQGYVTAIMRLSSLTLASIWRTVSFSKRSKLKPSTLNEATAAA